MGCHAANCTAIAVKSRISCFCFHLLAFIVSLPSAPVNLPVQRPSRAIISVFTWNLVRVICPLRETKPPVGFDHELISHLPYLSFC